MYEPPIKLIMGEMQTQFEENCMRAVQSYGFDVDKNELVKALEYDRNQYEKGYADGRHDAVVHRKWDEERFAFCNVCSNCGLVIDRTSIKMHSGKFNYCPNCGAKMDEVSE